MKTKALMVFLICCMALQVSAQSCVIGNGSSAVKECVKNQDLNFYEVLSFDGNKTHNFDVNLTIFKQTNSTYVLQNTAMKKYNPETGLYYFDINGGISTTGEYLAIIVAEHKTNAGAPDGNVGTVTYNFTLIDQNIHKQLSDTNTGISNAIASVQTSVNNISVGTGSAGSACNLFFSSDFSLNQYLYFTFSGMDTNGTAISSANFDLYRGNQKLVNTRSMNSKTDHLDYIFDKKFNDDIYKLVIRGSNCRVTLFCSTTKKGCY